jgi:N-acetylneuraminic acid mutarotase
MVVWGGNEGNTFVNTGGLYDPAADSWSPTATLYAPTGRYSHSAVWTGSRMIVWGGFDGSYFLSSGAQYNILSLYVKN